MIIFDHNRQNFTIIVQNQPKITIIDIKNFIITNQKIYLTIALKNFFGNTIDLTIALTKFFGEKIYLTIAFRKIFGRTIELTIALTTFWEK